MQTLSVEADMLCTATILKMNVLLRRHQTTHCLQPRRGGSRDVGRADSSPTTLMHFRGRGDDGRALRGDAPCDGGASHVWGASHRAPSARVPIHGHCRCPQHAPRHGHARATIRSASRRRSLAWLLQARGNDRAQPAPSIMSKSTAAARTWTLEPCSSGMLQKLWRSRGRGSRRPHAM